jgi:hypothetical protein
MKRWSEAAQSMRENHNASVLTAVTPVMNLTTGCVELGNCAHHISSARNIIKNSKIDILFSRYDFQTYTMASRKVEV